MDQELYDAEGLKVGDLKKISIQTARDAVVELESDADKYRIDFPKDTKPEVKLALLSALFHIDFMYYEDDVRCRARATNVRVTDANLRPARPRPFHINVQRSPREGKCCDLYWYVRARPRAGRRLALTTPVPAVAWSASASRARARGAAAERTPPKRPARRPRRRSSRRAARRRTPRWTAEPRPRPLRPDRRQRASVECGRRAVM